MIYLGWILNMDTMSIEHFHSPTVEGVQAQIDERWEEIRQEEEFDAADDDDDPMLAYYTCDIGEVPDLVPKTLLVELGSRVLTDCVDALEFGSLDDSDSWVTSEEAWEATRDQTLRIMKAAGIDTEKLLAQVREDVLSDCEEDADED